MSCYQIKISGQVQGVFFRHSAKQEAEKLGLVGYAKNLPPHLESRCGGVPDGSVEIIACLPTGDGDKEKIEEFINWCRQGPDLAQVEKVETKDMPFRKFQDFQII